MVWIETVNFVATMIVNQWPTLSLIDVEGHISQFKHYVIIK